MIYGAAEYTGRMVATNAKAHSLDFVIASGAKDEERLAPIARELDVEYRLFAADDRAAAEAALADADVLLNCAGPFIHIAGPLMRACIATGTHYLDITAEMDSYHLADALDEEAKAAGVMLLPGSGSGSGGSVAMLGSLACHAAKRVTAPTKLSIAIQIAGGFSRGSAVSASESLTPRPSTASMAHWSAAALKMSGPSTSARARPYPSR
jgi:short subunit dehydrogenase-like uncharacterized protein